MATRASFMSFIDLKWKETVDEMGVIVTYFEEQSFISLIT